MFVSFIVVMVKLGAFLIMSVMMLVVAVISSLEEVGEGRGSQAGGMFKLDTGTRVGRG